MLSMILQSSQRAGAEDWSYPRIRNSRPNAGSDLGRRAAGRSPSLSSGFSHRSYALSSRSSAKCSFGTRSAEAGRSIVLRLLKSDQSELDPMVRDAITEQRNIRGRNRVARDSLMNSINASTSYLDIPLSQRLPLRMTSQAGPRLTQKEQLAQKMDHLRRLEALYHREYSPRAYNPNTRQFEAPQSSPMLRRPVEADDVPDQLDSGNVKLGTGGPSREPVEQRRSTSYPTRIMRARQGLRPYPSASPPPNAIPMSTFRRVYASASASVPAASQEELGDKPSCRGASRPDCRDKLAELLGDDFLPTQDAVHAARPGCGKDADASSPPQTRYQRALEKQRRLLQRRHDDELLAVLSGLLQNGSAEIRSSSARAARRPASRPDAGSGPSAMLTSAANEFGARSVADFVRRARAGPSPDAGGSLSFSATGLPDTGAGSAYASAAAAVFDDAPAKLLSSQAHGPGASASASASAAPSRDRLARKRFFLLQALKQCDSYLLRGRIARELRAMSD